MWTRFTVWIPRFVDQKKRVEELNIFDGNERSINQFGHRFISRGGNLLHHPLHHSCCLSIIEVLRNSKLLLLSKLFMHSWSNHSISNSKFGWGRMGCLQKQFVIIILFRCYSLLWGTWRLWQILELTSSPVWGRSCLESGRMTDVRLRWDRGTAERPLNLTKTYRHICPELCCLLFSMS